MRTEYLNSSESPNSWTRKQFLQVSGVKERQWAATPQYTRESIKMKITVKKNPPKRAEVYDRLLEGEDKKNFPRRIAEVLIKSERKEKNEGKELSWTHRI